MSALALQLACLRRQAGGAPAATAPPAPSPIPEQLRRLLGVRTRSRSQAASLDRDLPGEEISRGLRLLERRYPATEIPMQVDARFANGRQGARFGVIPTGNFLHFDTETTGLSGGTGTRAFMIGAADWIDGQLRVRQLTLTAMAGEVAMLCEFANWLRPETVLVSYNGRCYDAPLLATRYRLARLPNPLGGLSHLDLLFPVRRRFSGSWENCRLATVERNWLGVLREDDLPGSEAPRAWRDFLRGESARDLRRVMAHNDQDLRSLGALLLRMADCEDLVLRSRGQRSAGVPAYSPAESRQAAPLPQST